MTPAEVLRKAADVIRERGWCQHHYSDGIRVCALGAINVGRGGFPEEDVADDAEDFLIQVIETDVPGWNDAYERTADEVIAALLKAAELAEGK